MSKKTELSELQGVLQTAKMRFDKLTNVLYEQMESSQRKRIVDRVD